MSQLCLLRTSRTEGLRHVSSLEVVPLPSPSTLSLSLICHRPAASTLSRPLHINNLSDPSLLVDATVLSVASTSDGSFLVTLDPRLPCSRETAVQLRSISGWTLEPPSSAEEMLETGLQSRIRRVKQGDSTAEVTELESLLVASSTGEPVREDRWRHGGFSQVFTDRPSQVFNCLRRPDAPLKPAFVISSIPFASLPQFCDIIKASDSPPTSSSHP